MNKTTWRQVLLITLLMLTVIACGISIDTGEEETKSEDPDIQQTLEALQKTQTVAASAPDDGQKSSDADEESDDDKDAGDETPCNKSRMASETIADGTKFNGGESFTKSWTLRNAGTCDWTTDYRFVYESGDQMGGASSIDMPSVVKPGDTVTFKVDLKAPSADGDYTGVWRLKAADGEKLGHYWVKITVGSGAPPAAAFAVTSVSFSTAASPIDLICPDLVTVTASITTNGPGTVHYVWSDNIWAFTFDGEINFDAAGTKTVQYEMQIDASGDYWAKLNIDSPNNQLFGPKNFQAVCNP